MLRRHAGNFLLFCLHVPRAWASVGRGGLIALVGLSSIAHAEMVGPSPDDAFVWALDVTAPNGQHNLLMGSMHVADRHLRQPDSGVLQSYRVIVTEHPDVNAGAAPAVRWVEALTADDLATLRMQVQCWAPPRVSTVAIDRMMAMLLAQPTPLEANQFAYERCESAGWAARDDIVARAASHYGLKPAYLETPEQAGDAPRALAKEVGADMGGRSVHFALSAEAESEQADFVDAMNEGDYDAAEAALDRSLAGAGIDRKVFDDIMVRRRNVNWMKTLPTLLDQGGAFVLVGAGHLPGRDGLIAMLRKRGYSVRPVKVPAGVGKLDDAMVS